MHNYKTLHFLPAFLSVVLVAFRIFYSMDGERVTN